MLETLSQELSDRSRPRYYHRIALHGLGGVGKTQIALEYAYRHESDYNYVFWISGVSQTELLSGFKNIARLSGCTKGTRDPSKIAIHVLNWLRVTKNWLLIIDNLDDISIVRNYLPTTDGAGHTLITTRNKNSDGIPAEGFEVPGMHPEDCVQFLLERGRLPDQTSEIRYEAHRIVEELGYLPLAIEQAASYIRISQNVNEYLTTYKKQRQELLNWRPSGNDPYAFTVAATLKLSLNSLQSSNPQVFALVQYLAFMNPDEILVEFLKDGIDVLPSNIQVLIKNNLGWIKSLKELEKFSLINVFKEGTRISIHRLVQAVIQDELDSSLQTSIVSHIIQLGLRCFPDMSNSTERESCRRYRSQVIACLEQGDGAKEGPEWQILSVRVGRYLFEDGFYKDSLRWRTLTFDIKKRVLGPDHPDTLMSMQYLAGTYLNMGRDAEAARIHEQMLEARKRTLGLEHPDTLSSMHGLATAFLNMGRHADGAQMLQQTLEARKRTLGPEHPDTLSSMHNLATAYLNLGRNAEGTQIHEQTLEVRKRTLGPDHPNTLMSMLYVATGYNCLGWNAKAAPMHEQTLEAQKRTLGPEHPDTLWSMHSVAMTYLHLGRNAEGAHMHEQALEVRKRTLGLEHPDTLWSAYGLAMAYLNLGRKVEGVQMHKETLEARKRTLGLEHPDTLRSMHSLAAAYLNLGRNADAALMHEQTLEAQKRTLGKEHPDTLRSMHELAAAYLNLGQNADGVQMLERTLKARERTLGPDHPDTLSSMYRLAVSYVNLGRNTQAAQMLEETLAAQRRILGPEHPDTLSSLRSLAAAHDNLGANMERTQMHDKTLPS